MLPYEIEMITGGPDDYTKIFEGIKSILESRNEKPLSEKPSQTGGDNNDQQSQTSSKKNETKKEDAEK
jgi:hypothetical protein